MEASLSTPPLFQRISAPSTNRDFFSGQSALWQENGFELYEVNESYIVPNSTVNEDAINSSNRTAAREVTEVLLTSFYELERAAYQRLGAAEGNKFVQWWIGKLRATTTLKGLNFDAWKSNK